MSQIIKWSIIFNNKWSGVDHKIHHVYFFKHPLEIKKLPLIQHVDLDKSFKKILFLIGNVLRFIFFRILAKSASSKNTVKTLLHYLDQLENHNVPSPTKKVPRVKKKSIDHLSLNVFHFFQKMFFSSTSNCP